MGQVRPKFRKGPGPGSTARGVRRDAFQSIAGCQDGGPPLRQGLTTLPDSSLVCVTQTPDIGSAARASVAEGVETRAQMAEHRAAPARLDPVTSFLRATRDADPSLDVDEDHAASMLLDHGFSQRAVARILAKCSFLQEERDGKAARTRSSSHLRLDYDCENHASDAAHDVASQSRPAPRESQTNHVWHDGLQRSACRQNAPSRSNRPRSRVKAFADLCAFCDSLSSADAPTTASVSMPDAPTRRNARDCLHADRAPNAMDRGTGTAPAQVPTSSDLPAPFPGYKRVLLHFPNG